MSTSKETTRSVHPRLSNAIAEQVNGYHSAVLNEVIQHVAKDDIVVVGMAWNPSVRYANNILKEKGFQHTYLEYGSYVSHWKQRLSIKMWSGWPTFPQVFVKGVLVGGFDDLKALMEKGEFQQLLDGDRHE